MQIPSFFPDDRLNMSFLMMSSSFSFYSGLAADFASRMSSIKTQSGLPVGFGSLSPLIPEVIPLTVIAADEVSMSLPSSSTILANTMLAAFFCMFVCCPL